MGCDVTMPAMATTPDVIVERFNERRDASSQVLEMMRHMRDIANGDVLVPLPEMNVADKPAVANLISEAIDQTSMRVASTMPELEVPPLHPRHKSSKQRAEKRRGAYLGWLTKNRYKRQLRRRTRHLVGYGQTGVLLRPDYDGKLPRWEVRDPLTTFPSPQEWFDEDRPEDTIFAYRKTLGWLKSNHPEAYQQIHKGDGSLDQPVEIVEHVDADEFVMLALTVKRGWETGGADVLLGGAEGGGSKVVEIARTPNRAGMCTAVVPARITLDRLSGQFTQLTGMYQARAELMALELIATKKAVFPDLALMPIAPNVTPKLLGGEWHDGRTGNINVIQNGEVRPIQGTSGIKTGEVLDRQQHEMRHGGGIPPQWGGEAATNQRTGRAGEVTMGATIDFRVQEYQETLADALAQELQVATRIAREYFGEHESSFYADWGNEHRAVEYRPDRDFDSETVIVRYPMPGADVNQMSIALGQRVGLELMSKAKARELDPLVEDPWLEADRVTAEALELAMRTSIQQMAAEGHIPPEDMAIISKAVVEDRKSLYEAVLEAQEQAEERQATPAEEGSPEAQPGLAPEGVGAEQPVEDPGMGGEPTDELWQLQQLLTGLRQPQTARGGGTEGMAAGPMGM